MLEKTKVDESTLGEAKEREKGDSDHSDAEEGPLQQIYKKEKEVLDALEVKFFGARKE